MKIRVAHASSRMYIRANVQFRLNCPLENSLELSPSHALSQSTIYCSNLQTNHSFGVKNSCPNDMKIGDKDALFKVKIKWHLACKKRASFKATRARAQSADRVSYRPLTIGWRILQWPAGPAITSFRGGIIDAVCVQRHRTAAFSPGRHPSVSYDIPYPRGCIMIGHRYADPMNRGR